MDGRAYLERLIAERLGMGAGQPEAGRAAALNLVELRGIAQGLVAAGVLDAGGAAALLADLEATLEQAGWLQHVRSTSRAARSVTARATGRGTVRDDWRERIENPPVPALLAVWPLAGREFRLGAVTYSLIALESWSTLFRLSYSYPWRRPRSPGELRQLRPRHVTWGAIDDRGRAYQPRGGAAHGGELVIFCDQTFEPGLPEEALEISFRAAADDDVATISVPRPAP